MKQRFKVVVVMILALAVILVIIDSTKNTTFEEVVSDHLNLMEVSSIEIIRSGNATEDKITITDPSQIKLIMNTFSQIHLRESSQLNKHHTESYWITIKSNKTREFGMTLYDEDYIDIYDYNSRKSKRYQITNEVNLIVIRGLFS